MSKVCLVALALLAAAVSAQNYCSNSPVSYTFSDPGQIAGFVWNGDSGTISCIEATTESRADAKALSVVVLCNRTGYGSAGPQFLKIYEYTNSYSTTEMNINCPRGTTAITVAATSATSSSFHNVKVWYNFVFTPSGEIKERQMIAGEY